MSVVFVEFPGGSGSELQIAGAGSGAGTGSQPSTPSSAPGPATPAAATSSGGAAGGGAGDGGGGGGRAKRNLSVAVTGTHACSVQLCATLWLALSSPVLLVCACATSAHTTVHVLFGHGAHRTVVTHLPSSHRYWNWFPVGECHFWRVAVAAQWILDNPPSRRLQQENRVTRHWSGLCACILECRR